MQMVMRTDKSAFVTKIFVYIKGIRGRIYMLCNYRAYCKVVEVARQLPVKKVYSLFYVIILFSSSSIVTAEEKGMITILIENKALQPRIVQVRDLVTKSKPAWICEEAQKTEKECQSLDTTNKNKGKTGNSPSKNDCDNAKKTLATKKCLFPDIIFDQKLDASEKVKIRIHTNFWGYGEIAVRAENNTLDWTIKSVLQEGDIVGHQ